MKVVVAMCALLVAYSAPAWAQQAEEEVRPGQTAYDQARDLYGDRQYAEAIPFLTQAIQAEPLGARYYIGLARAAFYAGQRDLAVRYYDIYLTHFPEHAQSASRRSDREEAIRRERGEANGQRDDSSSTPETPADQLAALAALEQRLEAGPMMSLDSTGAHSMYRALLRTGYAEPSLAVLQPRLREGVLAETHAMFWPTADALVPVGRVELWRSVRERYHAIRALGLDLMEDPETLSRLAAAAGQIDLINANYSEAEQHFREAVTLDANLLMAHSGLLLAVHSLSYNQGQTLAPDAFQILEQLEAMITLQAPHHLPLLAVARSMLLADTGDYTGSAQELIGLLAPDRAQ
jgi:tetratricopeptide (TPR) repeat protein